MWKSFCFLFCRTPKQKNLGRTSTEETALAQAGTGECQPCRSARNASTKHYGRPRLDNVAEDGASTCPLQFRGIFHSAGLFLRQSHITRLTSVWQDVTEVPQTHTHTRTVRNPMWSAGKRLINKANSTAWNSCTNAHIVWLPLYSLMYVIN